MKRLYMIGGPMGVGKTAACRQLQQLLDRSVFLDGDWCWDAHPFQVTEETREMVLENIAFLLNSFLRCSAYDHVIFCWVLHRREIWADLLRRLTYTGFNMFDKFVPGVFAIVYGNQTPAAAYESIRAAERTARQE